METAMKKLEVPELEEQETATSTQDVTKDGVYEFFSDRRKSSRHYNVAISDEE